jgi:hypothetical protein
VARPTQAPSKPTPTTPAPSTTATPAANPPTKPSAPTSAAKSTSPTPPAAAPSSPAGSAKPGVSPSATAGKANAQNPPTAPATPSDGASPGKPASTPAAPSGPELGKATPPSPPTGKTDAGAPAGTKVAVTTAAKPPRDDSPIDIEAEGLGRADAGPPGPDFANAPRRERTSPSSHSDPLPPPPTASIPGGPLKIPGGKVNLDSQRVDRFLEEGGSAMNGRVLDADSGAGVADAQIEAWMGTRSIHGETDSEGRFRFEGLVPGSRITLWLTATTKYVQERIDITVPGGTSNPFNTNFKLLPRSAGGGRSGGIGVFLNRRGGKTVVTGLDAFGPAERAGVEIGDSIVAVGNRQTADLGPGAIEYLLRGPLGANVEVSVAGKTGAPKKLTLKRTGR